MKIYITRHGQPLKEGTGLSEAGKKQAEALGSHLKNLGFSGNIYVKADKASEETAKIISGYTKSNIIIIGDILNKEDFDSLGITADSLFTFDGEGADRLCSILGIPVKGGMCNCTLCHIDLDKDTKRVYNDTGHLPYALRGYDYFMQSEEHGIKLKALMEKPLDIPPKKEGETRIFHISDTSSFYYPYYEKLIREVKADIIIHTGDFSDELKVGRIKACHEEYKQKVRIISDILKGSGAGKLYGVCGNNDIEAVMTDALPECEFVSPGSVIDICGIKCALGHGHTDIIGDFEWAFYGHGITGEAWSADKNNIKEGVCRFNAIWSFSVIDLPERSWYGIEYPEVE